MLKILIWFVGKTLILKEKSIRVAKKQEEARKEGAVENKENKEVDAETEEENQFFSGFGELFLDGDDPTEVDPSNERRNDDEDSVEEYKGEADAKVNTNKTEGRYFIKELWDISTLTYYLL